MKTYYRIFAASVLALAMCAFFPSLTAAQQAANLVDVPRTLSYQGLLRTSDGNPVTGDGQITVRLYADAAGSQLVWEDVFATKTQDGVFSLLLGSQKVLPDAGQISVPLWVAVKIGEAEELKPYTPLAASPYALTVANNSITAEKMATDYVGSISVNGTKVSAKGADVNFIAGDGLAVNFDAVSHAIILSGKAADNLGDKGATPQAANPLNALGQIIYGGVGGAQTALNGNSTTIRKFLNQTGTGSASAAPAWGTIAAGDINGLLTGTPNEITITTSGGIITYSTPQAIATSSSPTFANLTLVGKATSAATVSGDANSTLTTKGYVAVGDATNAAAIAAETTARQTAITAETNARTAGDNTLTTNLGNEVTNRQAAITNESNARIATDNTLATNLAGEVTRATGAEGTLTTNLTTEATTRSITDNVIISMVNTETVNRGVADATLATNLASEVTRATAAEGA